MWLSEPELTPQGLKIRMTLHGIFRTEDLDIFSQAYLDILDDARLKKKLLHVVIDAVHFQPTMDASNYLFVGKTIMTHPNMGIQVVATSSYTALTVVRFIGNLLSRSSVLIAQDEADATQLVRQGSKPMLMLDSSVDKINAVMDHLIAVANFTAPE